jgi:radical SAM protein with 4Fe4S-binding SPASM domain
MRKIFKILQILWSRPKGWRDFLLCYLSMLLKTDRVLGMPVNIVLEPTNVCNLRCPICETGAGILGRPSGMMTYDNFCKIVDKLHPSLNMMYLYFMGEPFLNKRIYDMIRYARKKNIYISLCTNGFNMDPEQIIDSGLDELWVQIAGLTPETHAHYRQGSDLDEIFRDVKRITDLKKQRLAEGRSAPTKVILGYFVMKSSEADVPKVRDKGFDLGVDEVQFIEACVRTVEQGKEYLPCDESFWFYDRAEFERGRLTPKKKLTGVCASIYFSMSIAWNGDVYPCCRDPKGLWKMGNVLEQPTGAIWNSATFRKFRASVRNNPASVQVCAQCSGLGIPYMFDYKSSGVKS